MENVENVSKRTRRKKRSNEREKNKDFVSNESNDSNIESDTSVKRILRNRSVNQVDNVVKKKRTRKQRKKKSLSEDTNDTVSSCISPEKANKSPVSLSCISSTDDNRSLNTSRKYDSPLLRLKKNISNGSPKKNEVDAEIEEYKEFQSDEPIQRKKKKRQWKKQNTIEMNVSEEQLLINDTSNHTETNDKTPLPKSSKKNKYKKWIDATDHSFKEVDIDSNPNRETYRLESSALNSLVLSGSPLKCSKNEKSKEWIDATEHSFKEVDTVSNPDRGTYQLENSALNSLVFSSSAKPRKKWSTVNTTDSHTLVCTPIKMIQINALFDTPSELTRNSLRLSTRAGTSRKSTQNTPFVKKKSIMKVTHSQLKNRNSIRKSILKTKSDISFKDEISPTIIETSQSISKAFNVIDAEDFTTRNDEKQIKIEETIGNMFSRKSNVVDIVDNSFDVVEDDVIIERNYNVKKNSNSKAQKSRKDSFNASDKEILDSTFVIEEEDDFKPLDNNEEDAQCRTYSFDGIEKTPLICHSTINNFGNTNDLIINETLNGTEINPLENTPKLTQSLAYVTDDSFVTKKNRNVSLKMTSPPWNVGLSNAGNSSSIATKNDKQKDHRVSLSKKLSKPKLSPTAKLSTTLKATKIKVMKTPRFSGEKAQAILRMMNDSTNPRSESNCDKKMLGGRPSGTSTPRVFKKSSATSIMKSILDKSKKNVTFTESVSSPTVAKIKKSKMPNFSLIHQKQFERMESLSGYKERKEERAKLLLSGSKVPNCYSNTKSSSTLQKSVLDSSDALNNSRKVHCNKRLEFNKSQNLSIQYTSPKKSANKSCILQNKTPKKKVITNNKTPSKTNTTLFKTSEIEIGQNINMQDTSPKKGANKSSTLQNKTPKKEFVTNNKTPSKLNTKLFQASQINKFASPKKPSTSNFPLVNKNSKSADQLKLNKSIPTESKISQKSKLPGSTKTVQEKLVENKNNLGSKRLDKNGFTRFGFKKSSKEEMIALASKSRVPQGNVQSRRTVVQGVRTNRRFELLMKMRNK